MRLGRVFLPLSVEPYIPLFRLCYFMVKSIILKIELRLASNQLKSVRTIERNESYRSLE